jgi:hypothetical protein
VTVFGQDSFTVVPGVADNLTNWDESIKERVIQMLTDKAETGDQSNESAADAASDVAADAAASAGAAGASGAASSSTCPAETECGIGRGSGCGGAVGDGDGACNQNTWSAKSGKNRFLSATARLLGWCLPSPSHSSSSGVLPSA